MTDRYHILRLLIGCLLLIGWICLCWSNFFDQSVKDAIGVIKKNGRLVKFLGLKDAKKMF